MHLWNKHYWLNIESSDSESYLPVNIADNFAIGFRIIQITGGIFCLDVVWKPWSLGKEILWNLPTLCISFKIPKFRLTGFLHSKGKMRFLLVAVLFQTWLGKFLPNLLLPSDECSLKACDGPFLKILALRGYDIWPHLLWQIWDTKYIDHIFLC